MGALALMRHCGPTERVDKRQKLFILDQMRGRSIGALPARAGRARWHQMTVGEIGGAQCIQEFNFFHPEEMENFCS